MKKFVFELEDILQFRKFEQEQAEIALAKALSDEREIQEKIEKMGISFSQGYFFSKPQPWQNNLSVKGAVK